jgi:hypothetical protein
VLDEPAHRGVEAAGRVEHHVGHAGRCAQDVARVNRPAGDLGHVHQALLVTLSQPGMRRLLEVGIAQ